MAKLKSERIMIKDRDLHYKDELGLDFKIDINVSQDGEFTCYLPEDVTKLLSDAGVRLKMNPKAGRNARIGFFSATTLPNLINNVKETCHEYISKEVIEEKIVIKYVVDTCCSYVKDGDNFWPNGRFTERFQKLGFTGGTQSPNATWPLPFGFHLFTQVLMRRVYRYKSGEEKVFYDRIDDDDTGERPHLKWLAGVVSNKANGNIQEIDYTEEVAEFFVSMYKSLFKINERMKDMVSPDAIQKLVNDKIKLLG